MSEQLNDALRHGNTMVLFDSANIQNVFGITMFTSVFL